MSIVTQLDSPNRAPLGATCPSATKGVERRISNSGSINIPRLTALRSVISVRHCGLTDDPLIKDSEGLRISGSACGIRILKQRVFHLNAVLDC